MAATPSVLLSPCPANAGHTIPMTMSSSPSLPSPSQLFPNIALCPQSGSKVAHIHSDAVAGFASASILLRQDESNGVDAPTIGFQKVVQEVKDGLQKGKNLQTQSKSSKHGPGKIPTFKRPNVSHEGDAGSGQEHAASTELRSPTPGTKDNDVLAPKKPRRKKSNEGAGESAQTKIKKSKIIKPGTTKRAEKSMKTTGATKKPKAAVSAVSEPMVGTQAEDAQAREEFRDLCLEKAIPMRKNWTPVKDTVRSKVHIDAIEGPPGPVHLLENPKANEQSATCFGKLVGDFGFAQKNECTKISFEVRQYENDEAVFKRRKIELVHAVHAPPLAEKAQRTKSSKKKAQTVTGKATAPFGPVESSTSSLLQYFGAPMVESEGDSEGQNSNAATPVIVGRKSPVRKVAKPKAKKQRQPVLLSPKSAMKTASNQDLVFGTCSQLAREESPALLKEVQQAIKASKFLDDEWHSLAMPSARYKPYNSLALTRPKDLWSIASRNLDGALLNAEVVDLSDTPKSRKILNETTPIPVAPETLEIEQAVPLHSGTDTGVTDVNTAPVFNVDPSPTAQQQAQEPSLILPRSVAEATLKKRPKNRSPVKKVTGGKPSLDQMPNYKGYTDVQLSKAVASYGFKTIKKREAMTVLLERCWKSKVSMALQEVPTNVNMPQPTISNVNAVDKATKANSPAERKGMPPKGAAAKAPFLDEATNPTPKKPRGRPRKDSSSKPPPTKRKRKVSSPHRSSTIETAGALAADDIYDSSPPTPSPPRRRSSSKQPSQLPLSQSVNTTTSHTDVVTGREAEERLFAVITNAITTFPPCKDCKNLTFHQKMLLYEPIVLEDLTVWLNAEGLGRVGEDNEVSPEQVKAWCEARSVCCLWRENLRGGARVRC